jgi:tetratricopeptide (TPR) repeat protein
MVTDVFHLCLIWTKPTLLSILIPVGGIEGSRRKAMNQAKTSILLSFVLILLASDCSTSSSKSSSKRHQRENSDLSTLLERHGWTYIEIPSAEIRPGVIGTLVSGNFTPRGDLRDCFPKELLEKLTPTGPYPVSLPYLTDTYSFKASAGLGFADYFKLLGTGSSVKSYSVLITDPETLSISQLVLMEYLSKNWEQIKEKYCGKQIWKFSTHVITSVLSARAMTVRLYDKEGRELDFSGINLFDILKVGAGVTVDSTKKGQLHFENESGLPFAYRSVPFDIPEARGHLEVLHPVVRFPKGQNSSHSSIRNAGKRDLHWRVKDHPVKGFILEYATGHLIPEEEAAIPVDRNNDCVSPEEDISFTVAVDDLDQESTIQIIPEDPCPASVQSRLSKGKLQGVVGKIVRAESLYRAGKFSEALAELTTAEVLNPDITKSPAYQRIRGLALYKAGHADDALISFRSLSNVADDGHVLSAYLLASRGNLPEAERELTKGQKALAQGTLLNGELLQSFNQPLEACLFPASIKAVSYKDELKASVQLVKEVVGLEFDAVFESQARRLYKLDNELPRFYADMVFCVYGKTLDLNGMAQLAERINEVLRGVLHELAYDVRPEARLHATEQMATRNRYFREAITGLIHDFSVFIAQRFKLDQKGIRSNIFMLRENGMLGIPQGLSHNMYDMEELGIQIPVGYGSTGVAFERKLFTITALTATEAGQVQRVAAIWAGHVQEQGGHLSELRTADLPASESAKASRSIVWIISVPIIEGQTGRVLGVLNADCVSSSSVFPGHTTNCASIPLAELKQVERESYFWASRLVSVLR